MIEKSEKFKTQQTYDKKQKGDQYKNKLPSVGFRS